jgi:ankyrin repeat protein
MRLRLLLSLLALIVFGNLQAATIHETIEQSDSAAVAAMLDSNPALLGDRLPNGKTPLHTAAYAGKIDIVRLLIDRGADLNAATTAGSVPLHGAAINGHEAVIRLLVEKGAEVNVTNQGGYTPLTNAAIFGNVATIKFLLDSGAKIEPTTPTGMVPLLCAINSLNPEAVECFLAAGADPKAVSPQGESAVLLATLWGNWNPNQAAAVPGIIQSLVKHGADPNRALPNGMTPILYAVGSSDTTILKALLDVGADLNIVAGSGATAFGEAVEAGQTNAVKLLIGRGARTDGVEIAFGRTPLHFAVLRGELPMVETILPVIPDLNTIDSASMTPLDYADRYGHKKIAEILRQKGAKGGLKKAGAPSSILFTKQPKEGEAYLWYLGNCGYLIKTRNHSLIFDYFTQRMNPTEPSLANGFINPSDFASEDVTAFVSHEHGDHFDSTIFSWTGKIPKLQYVFGFMPDSLEETARQGYSGQPYEYIGPGMTKTVDGMNIMAVRSNDAGVGFVIKVDGLTIYHAGDLAGWLPNQREGFTSQIDSIDAAFDSVDIALVNVTGCHHQDTLALAEGTAYTITKLDPKLVIPTHGAQREYYYRQFMNKFRDQFPNLQSFCPLVRGDAARYANGRISVGAELL